MWVGPELIFKRKDQNQSCLQNVVFYEVLYTYFLYFMAWDSG